MRKSFYLDKDGKVQELNPLITIDSKVLGTVIVCESKEEAELLFKEFHTKFPKGGGLLERLTEIPFEGVEPLE